MPIIRFCFCRSRGAGAYGGRSKDLFDKKHETCRRVFLGLMLILYGTALIFGVFVTNSYLHMGIKNAKISARYGVNDTLKYTKTTSVKTKHLFVTNYDQLNVHLKDTPKNTTDK